MPVALKGDEVNAAVNFVYRPSATAKPETVVLLSPEGEERWRPETERWLRSMESPTMVSSCGVPATVARTLSSNERSTSAISPANTPSRWSSRIAIRSFVSGVMNSNCPVFRSPGEISEPAPILLNGREHFGQGILASRLGATMAATQPSERLRVASQGSNPIDEARSRAAAVVTNLTRAHHSLLARNQKYALLYEFFQEFQEHQPSNLAKQTAYSLLYAVPSILITLISLAAIVDRNTGFGISESLREYISTQAPPTCNPCCNHWCNTLWCKRVPRPP